MIEAVRTGICSGGPLAGEARAARGTRFNCAVRTIKPSLAANRIDVPYVMHSYIWDSELSCWIWNGETC